MTTEQENQTTLINKTPGVCGGDACIGNRRIPVWQLIECRRLGMSDQRIMTDFDPPLTPADLQAAWDHYALNRFEIEEAIRLNDDSVDAEVQER